MQIKQLSVFLENKGGRLNDVAKILGQAGINMSAFSLAESSDFGILRVIVSDPVKAQAILKENKFAVSLTDVICVQVSNSPGALARILNIITDNGISIDYMYAFAEGSDANVILKPDKTDDCISILQKNKISLIAADELYKI